MGFAIRVRSAGPKYGPTCHQRVRADVTEFVTLVRLSSFGQHVGVLVLAGYKHWKSALAVALLTVADQLEADRAQGPSGPSFHKSTMTWLGLPPPPVCATLNKSMMEVLCNLLFYFWLRLLICLLGSGFSKCCNHLSAKSAVSILSVMNIQCLYFINTTLGGDLPAV